jgi:hypothetical protein
MISKIMIVNLAHGTKTGYYAGATTPFYSPKFGGHNYHEDRHGVHTFSYFLSADFVGSIVMQASLVAEPNDSDWATLEDTRVTVTTPSGEVATTKNYVGHVIWFRAEITDFTAGTIVKLQHSN